MSVSFYQKMLYKLLFNKNDLGLKLFFMKCTKEKRMKGDSLQKDFINYAIGEPNRVLF